MREERRSNGDDSQAGAPSKRARTQAFSAAKGSNQALGIRQESPRPLQILAIRILPRNIVLRADQVNILV
jgi:hypothetical protein